MFKAIGQFFHAFFTLFYMVDKFAGAGAHLGEIVEDEAAGLKAEMAVERKARLAAAVKRLNPDADTAS